MVDVAVRLGVCHFPPFTYVLNGAVFGPWVWAAQNAVPDNSTYEFVRLDDDNCTMSNMLGGISAAAYDVAVHPMVMDAECDSCSWSYPLSGNGLVTVMMDDHSEKKSIFIDVFPDEAWYCIAALSFAFMASAIAMEWPRARFHHMGYTFLSLITHLHTPDCISGGTYVLYANMVVFATLILSLYTAELTSTILQDKIPLGTNIRGLVNSGRPFTVVDGGPLMQMKYEYPQAAYDVLPQSSALKEDALPTLMLYEQGEMLVKGSCDPLASTSGAISRVAYSMAFRTDFEGRREMDVRLRELSVTDTMETTMLTWITKKYACVEQKAAKLDADFVSPYLWTTLSVSIAVIIFNLTIERKWIRQVSHE